MKPGLDYTGIGVGFCCHDGNCRWLLHKRGSAARDEQGTWDFGGGALEFGESLEDGARRETREEYGCEVIAVQDALKIFSRVSELNGAMTHWITIAFIAQVDPRQVQLNDLGAMEEIGWYRFNSLPKPLHSWVARVVQDNAAIFEQYS